MAIWLWWQSFRSVVLKSECAPVPSGGLVKTDGPHPQSFWISRSGMVAQGSVFLTSTKWYWCLNYNLYNHPPFSYALGSGTGDPLLPNKKYPERQIGFLFLAFTRTNGTFCHSVIWSHCLPHVTVGLSLNKIKKTLHAKHSLSILNFVCVRQGLGGNYFFGPTHCLLWK